VNASFSASFFLILFSYLKLNSSFQIRIQFPKVTCSLENFFHWTACSFLIFELFFSTFWSTYCLIWHSSRWNINLCSHVPLNEQCSTKMAKAYMTNPPEKIISRITLVDFQGYGSPTQQYLRRQLLRVTVKTVKDERFKTLGQNIDTYTGKKINERWQVCFTLLKNSRTSTLGTSARFYADVQFFFSTHRHFLLPYRLFSHNTNIFAHCNDIISPNSKHTSPLQVSQKICNQLRCTNLSNW